MTDNDHPIDIKIISHLLFILMVFILVSFVLFDLTIPEYRSLAYYSLFAMCICYFIAGNAMTSNFLPQTNYELPSSFAGMCLGMWVVFADLNLSPDSPSRFSALILIFSILCTFLVGSYVVQYEKERRQGDDINLLFLLPSVLVMICMTLVVLYILVVGNWDWPIMGLFDALEEITAESSRSVKPLFM
jgi:hypothetical protein